MSGWQTPKDLLGDIIKYRPEITFNTSRTYDNGKKAPDGIEIRFGKTRPTEELRSKLKAAGFRFSEKQKMWYAFDNAKSKAFAEQIAESEQDVDDTQYEKLNFWAVINSKAEYDKLHNRTEFAIKRIGDGPDYYYNKKTLEKWYDPAGLIRGGFLSFKKFYNKVIETQPEEQSKDEPKSEKAKPQHTQTDVAKKLRALAEGMQKQVDAKLNSAIGRQRPTARRARIAASMEKEGFQLKRTQDFLFELAKAHESGKIKEFDILESISTKSQAEIIAGYPDNSETSRDYYLSKYKVSLEKCGIEFLGDWYRGWLQYKELMNWPQSVPAGTNDMGAQIRKMERELIGKKIPGFFPTPPDLIERMIELAELKANDSILEPSAGKGDILDAIRAKKLGVELECMEVNYSLREILKAKNYDLIGDDFLSYNPEISTRLHNKMLMNPPFEKGQDIDHVTHALKCIYSNGKVVAVMSEGVFFRADKKATAFRELLHQKGAYISEPIKEAFKSSFNSTGVAVRIVAIDGDKVNHSKGALTVKQRVELEALAEIELLKLEFELKSSGLSGTETKLHQLEQQAWAKKAKWEVLNFN